MEVHHHPNLHHEKKKFREYFLEFLMIFLAVSMGFIAENMREGISDRAKEKEYIKNFIVDLKHDTASLREYINLNHTQIKGIDSILTLARQNISTPSNRQLFYTLNIRYMFIVYFFKNDDVTLSQLRNAGGYRLLQKDSVADKIAAYDQENIKIYDQEKAYDKSMFDAMGIVLQLIDMTVYHDTAYFKRGIPTGKELPPILNDPQKTMEFFNKAYFARQIIRTYTDYYLSEHIESSKELIAFLQKTYHLENE